MAWITKTFDSYSFRIHARKGDTTAATIFCKQDQQTVAWLIFRYGVDATEARLTQDGTTPLLSYPASMLGPIFDTLRTEQPLYVHMNPEEKWGYITSGVEAVGEEEHRA